MRAPDANASSAPAGDEPEITVSDAPNGTLLVTGGAASSNLSTSYSHQTGPQTFDISLIQPGGDTMVDLRDRYEAYSKRIESRGKS